MAIIAGWREPTPACDILSRSALLRPSTPRYAADSARLAKWAMATAVVAVEASTWPSMR